MVNNQGLTMARPQTKTPRRTDFLRTWVQRQGPALPSVVAPLELNPLNENPPYISPAEKGPLDPGERGS